MGRHDRDIFAIFYNMKVCRVLSVESPHRGDSNEYPQNTIFNVKIAIHYPKSAAMGILPKDSRTSSQ